MLPESRRIGVVLVETVLLVFDVMRLTPLKATIISTYAPCSWMMGRVCSEPWNLSVSTPPNKTDPVAELRSSSHKLYAAELIRPWLTIC